MRNKDKKMWLMMSLTFLHVISLGPWANQRKNDGFRRGWVGLSALSEGKIQDVILSVNEVVGKIEIL